MVGTIFGTSLGLVYCLLDLRTFIGFLGVTLLLTFTYLEIFGTALTFVIDSLCFSYFLCCCFLIYFGFIVVVLTYFDLLIVFYKLAGLDKFFFVFLFSFFCFLLIFVEFLTFGFLAGAEAMVSITLLTGLSSIDLSLEIFLIITL